MARHDEDGKRREGTGEGTGLFQSTVLSAGKNLNCFLSLSIADIFRYFLPHVISL